MTSSNDTTPSNNNDTITQADVESAENIIKDTITVEVHDTFKYNTVVRHKPRITRDTMSKYEFVRVITAVAKYLMDIKDLGKYCDDIEVTSLINPCEIAFRLLMNGRMNATLNRLGYECVTFSELRINPIWVHILEHYYQTRHDAEMDELLEPLKILVDNK